MHIIRKYLKQLIACILLLSITIPFISLRVIDTKGYSADNVYNSIAQISDEKYKGRRLGTEENLEAVKYIEQQFKQIGLTPVGSNNSYLDEYTELTKGYNGKSILELLDKDGKVIKQYNFGTDFREHGYGYSAFGDIISGYDLFNYYLNNSTKKTDKEHLAAIVDTKRLNSRYIKDLFIKSKQAGFEALLISVPDWTDLSRESANTSYVDVNNKGYQMPSLLIKRSVSEEIYKYINKGYKLHIRSAIQVEYKPAYNVIGMIPGKSDKYLILSAHLDHVGPSSDGAIYPGALDNASGIAAIIEIARFLKSQNATPTSNIVFIAFNGEEAGLLGSRHYVSKPRFPLDMSTVINLDMVGSRDNIPLTIMYNSAFIQTAGLKIDPSARMRENIEGLANKYGIPTTTVDEYSSDHVYFNINGVPAITLIDYKRERTHTPSDDIKNIGKENIDRALKLVISYISQTQYLNLSSNGYSILLDNLLQFLGITWILLIVITVLILLIFIKEKKDRPKVKNDKVPKVTMAIVVLAMIVISYFPIIYTKLPSSSESLVTLLFSSPGIILKTIILSPALLLFLFPGYILMYFAKRRLDNWDYKGNGVELTFAYYVAILLVVVLSFIAISYLNKPIYNTLTPDFVKSIHGKLIFFYVIALIAYLLHKLACYEGKLNSVSFKGFTIIAFIYLMLLSAFYVPIAANKYVMNANSGSINIGETIDIKEFYYPQ